MHLNCDHLIHGLFFFFFCTGVYVFGLFTTDVFVSAGQLVTGSLAPYFLSVCQLNYSAVDCQDTVSFVWQSDACTGDPDDIIRAKKTFPSKEAALSLYTAVYLAVSDFFFDRIPFVLSNTSNFSTYVNVLFLFQMYIMSCSRSFGAHLLGPFVSLSLVSLAVLTGINRVAENRNHWSDVLAGQTIGAGIAVFLVSYI